MARRRYFSPFSGDNLPTLPIDQIVVRLTFPRSKSVEIDAIGNDVDVGVRRHVAQRRLGQAHARRCHAVDVGERVSGDEQVERRKARRFEHVRAPYRDHAGVNVRPRGDEAVAGEV